MSIARWWWRWAAGAVALAGVAAIALMPTKTTQGIDYDVVTHRMRLYEKGLDFLQRDSSYARLVAEIVPAEAPPEATALALFDWTRQNVRDQPSGFPVIDDHVSHIIIRGYGVADQKADVFTTLATYAGVPAYWTRIGERPHVVLSLAWIDRRWRVFDVENGIVFRTSAGALAAVDDLAADPALTKSVAADRIYHARPYVSYFAGFLPPVAPDLLRAEQQMLWPRAMYNTMRLIGLGRREWQLQ